MDGCGQEAMGNLIRCVTRPQCLADAISCTSLETPTLMTPPNPPQRRNLLLAVFLSVSPEEAATMSWPDFFSIITGRHGPVNTNPLIKDFMLAYLR